jgi:hypothetical protein
VYINTRAVMSHQPLMMKAETVSFILTPFSHGLSPDKDLTAFSYCESFIFYILIQMIKQPSWAGWLSFDLLCSFIFCNDRQFCDFYSLIFQALSVNIYFELYKFNNMRMLCLLCVLMCSRMRNFFYQNDTEVVNKRIDK